jgi:hypothetical protein
MRHATLILSAICLLIGFSFRAKADTVNLGTAGNFAVLAGSAITNTGPTTIIGDVGINPNGASSISGFGSVILTGTVHAADGVALQAQNDLTTAYDVAAGLSFTQDLTGIDLDTFNTPATALTPGVYSFSSSAQLSGTLYLNDENNPNAQFVFQIGSTLTTSSGSAVIAINDGTMPGCNVFWQVGSSATLGTTTAFEGNILAMDSITMNTGATILDGSALASTGAVTMDSVTIDNCGSSSSTTASVPLPSALASGLILFGMSAIRMAFKRAKAT